MRFKVPRVRVTSKERQRVAQRAWNRRFASDVRDDLYRAATRLLSMKVQKATDFFQSEEPDTEPIPECAYGILTPEQVVAFQKAAEVNPLEWKHNEKS